MNKEGKPIPAEEQAPGLSNGSATQERPVGIFDLWESIKETRTPLIIRGPDPEGGENE